VIKHCFLVFCLDHGQLLFDHQYSYLQGREAAAAAAAAGASSNRCRRAFLGKMSAKATTFTFVSAGAFVAVYLLGARVMRDQCPCMIVYLLLLRIACHATFIHLRQLSSIFSNLHQSSSIFINLHQSFINLHQSSSIFINLHQSSAI